MKLETAQRNLQVGEIIKENIDNIRKIEEEVMNLEIMIEEGHLAIEEDLLAREMTEEEIIEAEEAPEIAEEEVLHTTTEGNMVWNTWAWIALDRC